MKHPNSQVEEQNRVDYVIDEIEAKEKVLLQKAKSLKESVVDLREKFFDDVTVNIDNLDEIIETYASIKQQAELLSERERTHGIIYKQLQVLERLKNAPYFGRIDFQEDGEKEVEQIYIGIASLMDQKDENFLIYDWRAPISSLYYDYAPGRVQFDSPHATIKGEMSLKRQFVIENGKIETMFDTGLTIGDEILQKSLGEQASTQMKNIVATIQREQNQIIRNEQHKYLIVQGAAGSGKTSAALQRIAYLMYRYRDFLSEDEIILFSPNPLFNSYVANVLPELGEANMRQTTFLEYIITKIEEHLDVETPFEQMEYMLTKKDDPEYSNKLKNITYKSSGAYKKLLDEYIDQLVGQGMVFQDIHFRGELFLPKETIEEIFYQLEPKTSLQNMLHALVDELMKRIQDFRKEQEKEDWVMYEIESLDDEEILDVYMDVQEQEGDDEFYDTGIEIEQLQEIVIDRAFRPVIEQVQSFQFINVFKLYEQIFTDWSSENLPEDWSFIQSFTRRQLENYSLPWEDATPYIYLKERLLGENTDRSVKYLFIDEAQDYTEFQLAYFQHIFPHTRMTFLGDVNQAIFVQTKDHNPLINDFIDTYEKIELNKSYRSTKQIIEFTDHFSPTGKPIEPFERNGEKPTILHAEDPSSTIASILQGVQTLQKNGHQMIAIVCKTYQETKILYGQLQEKINLRLMTETSRELTEGTLILPVYLAKGIEFDAVIVPNVTADHYHNDHEKYLLYTACTRAMHELVLVGTGELSPFIQKIPEDKYNLLKIQS